jgi:hypothetical protein
VAEYKSGHVSFGNDAESNEGLNLQWGFNLTADVSPEELTNMLNCFINTIADKDSDGPLVAKAVLYDVLITQGRAYTL